MFNLDDITVKNDNQSWPNRKLIIGPSGSEKTNYLLNSIKKNNNIIDKIYLYPNDIGEPKYQLSIDRKEKAGLKNLKDQNAFIEYSNTMMIFMRILKTIIKKEREKIRLFLMI